MPSIDRIARTINGPNEVQHLSVAKLEELQDIRWGQLHVQKQIDLLRTAKFVQALFETQPDGWVITNGDDTKCRTIDTSSHYVGGNVVMWTDSLGDALQFARHKDAEAFCEDDDDAWHIRRVSDVLKMWADQARAALATIPGNGFPVSAGAPERAAIGEEAEPPLPARLLGVDERSVQHLLQLFRAFVTQNAAVWKPGSNHHHPIWQDVAIELDAHDRNYDASEGPDWAFIQAENRKTYQVLVEEHADMINEREATERGG